MPKLTTDSVIKLYEVTVQYPLPWEIYVGKGDIFQVEDNKDFIVVNVIHLGGEANTYQFDIACITPTQQDDADTQEDLRDLIHDDFHVRHAEISIRFKSALRYEELMNLIYPVSEPEVDAEEVKHFKDTKVVVQFMAGERVLQRIDDALQDLSGYGNFELTSQGNGLNVYNVELTGTAPDEMLDEVRKIFDRFATKPTDQLVTIEDSGINYTVGKYCPEKFSWDFDLIIKCQPEDAEDITEIVSHGFTISTILGSCPVTVQGEVENEGSRVRAKMIYDDKFDNSELPTSFFANVLPTMLLTEVMKSLMKYSCQVCLNTRTAHITLDQESTYDL